MSFDLKIVRGDIGIGPDGDIDIVIDINKLVQDILKILQTPLGSNVFYQWYGSLLTDSVIGNTLDTSITANVIQQQIRSNLETLQRMQREQAANDQILTPGELLAAIENVSVNRNPIDPTRYDIVVRVITKAFRTAVATLDVQM